MSQEEKEELENFLWAHLHAVRMRPANETVTGRLRGAINRDGYFEATAVQWRPFGKRQFAIMGAINITADKWRIYYLEHHNKTLSEVHYTERPASQVNL